MGGREPVTLPKMSFYYQTSTEAILMCLHNYHTHTEVEFSPLCFYVLLFMFLCLCFMLLCFYVLGFNTTYAISSLVTSAPLGWPCISIFW